MTTNNRSKRILIADDSDMIRSGMCSLLESHEGWIVCGEAANGTEAIDKAIALKPDVILLDVSMPQLNGFEAAEHIHNRMPSSKILVVTEHDAKTLDKLPPRPGVCGYIMKSRLDSDLISAVEAA